MKAVIVPAPGSVTIANVPDALPPKPGEVMIKLKAMGICGSDIHVYHGRSSFASYPRIIGHELAGEVVAVGDSNGKVFIGDHVVIDPVNSCGECYACSIGRSNVCKNIKVLAAHVDGGFREYITSPIKNVHKIDKRVPWEIAATVEPYSIAAEALARGDISQDDSVLICGAGPIGITLLQASLRITKKIMILDNVGERIHKAKSMGNVETLNPQTENASQKIMDWTGGEGVNLILEATGNVKVMESCISEWASQAGRVVTLGFSASPMSIAPLDIMKRELDIRGSRLSRNRFPEVISWIENKEVNPEKLISHKFSFYDAENAIKQVDLDPAGTLKVILSLEDM